MDPTTPAVVMYGTRWCPFCEAAREFLDGRGVAYEDIRVDADPSLRDEMREKGGGRTVPQIWIRDVHVGGFTDMVALDRAGRLTPLLRGGAQAGDNDE